MTNSYWFNLPVKDLQCSKVFFKELGATFVENETNEMFGIYLGKNKVQVMMFSYVQFEQFTQAKVADLIIQVNFLYRWKLNRKRSR